MKFIQAPTWLLTISHIVVPLTFCAIKTIGLIFLLATAGAHAQAQDTLPDTGDGKLRTTTTFADGSLLCTESDSHQRAECVVVHGKMQKVTFTRREPYTLNQVLLQLRAYAKDWQADASQGDGDVSFSAADGAARARWRGTVLVVSFVTPGSIPDAPLPPLPKAIDTSNLLQMPVDVMLTDGSEVKGKIAKVELDGVDILTEDGGVKIAYAKMSTKDQSALGYDPDRIAAIRETQQQQIEAQQKAAEEELSRPRWIEVASFSGKSDKNTEPFTITGNRWRVRWSTSPSDDVRKFHEESSAIFSANAVPDGGGREDQDIVL